MPARFGLPSAVRGRFPEAAAWVGDAVSAAAAKGRPGSVQTKTEAARIATNEKYSALRVLCRDLKTMGITSRLASQFDHERCIPVKRPAGAAGTHFRRSVRHEKLRLRFVYSESNIQQRNTIQARACRPACIPFIATDRRFFPWLNQR